MGLFSFKRKPVPPYDKLEADKRFALYFLLEYLTTRGVIPVDEMPWALSYLEKAARYFGISKNDFGKILQLNSMLDIFWDLFGCC